MEYDFTLTVNVDGRVRQGTEGRHAAMCRRRLRLMTSSLSGSHVLQSKGLVLALPFANPVERRGRAIRKKEKSTTPLVHSGLWCQLCRGFVGTTRPPGAVTHTHQLHSR